MIDEKYMSQKKEHPEKKLSLRNIHRDEDPLEILTNPM